VITTNTLVLDTSFISALLVENDVHHQAAHATLSALESPYFFIPMAVILELGTLPLAIENNDYFNAIDQFLSAISYTLIEYDKDFSEYFIALTKHYGHKVKPFDFSILVCCVRVHGELLSFDEKLLNHLERVKKMPMP